MPRIAVFLVGCALGYVLGGYVDEYLDTGSGKEK